MSSRWQNGGESIGMEIISCIWYLGPSWVSFQSWFHLLCLERFWSSYTLWSSRHTPCELQWPFQSCQTWLQLPFLMIDIVGWDALRRSVLEVQSWRMSRSFWSHWSFLVSVPQTLQKDLQSERPRLISDYRLLHDSNSDCWSLRQACWPFDPTRPTLWHWLGTFYSVPCRYRKTFRKITN